MIGATGAFVHNEKAVALAQEQADVFAVIGVHPHDAKTITPETYTRLRELAQQPKVVGLGETGLDFYYDNSPREAQRTHFRAFIRLAQELGLPLSMHVRDAYTSKQPRFYAKKVETTSLESCTALPAIPKKLRPYLRLGYISLSVVL